MEPVQESKKEMTREMYRTSQKSSEMEESIATIRTDFTELTTIQLEIARFKELIPLGPTHKITQEYLELVGKQIF